jgi:hypothetical protein
MMPTRSEGPLFEDVRRAIKVARQAGAKAVRIERGGVAVVIPLDDSYVGLLAKCQHPAPDAEAKEERVKLEI